MNKMQERDKFNTSCREHSMQIDIDHVTRHIAWKRDDCPVCRIISLEQQLQQAHRDATEEVDKAHKRGWEQAKRECEIVVDKYRQSEGFHQGRIAAKCISDAIAGMEYKEKAND